MEPERSQPTRWYSRIIASLFSTSAPAGRSDLPPEARRRVNPPRDPPGERPDFRGLAPQSGSLGREYKTGSGWPAAALVLVVVGVGLTVASPGWIERLLYGPPSSARNMAVLVVSAVDADLIAARQTLLPRGYTVRTAADADAAIEEVQQRDVGFVLIDGDIAGARRVTGAVHSARPGARIMTLTGKRDIREVSERLINAGF